jgi:hypothetical protein
MVEPTCQFTQTPVQPTNQSCTIQLPAASILTDKVYHHMLQVEANQCAAAALAALPASCSMHTAQPHTAHRHVSEGEAVVLSIGTAQAH